MDAWADPSAVDQRQVSDNGRQVASTGVSAIGVGESSQFGSHQATTARVTKNSMASTARIMVTPPASDVTGPAPAGLIRGIMPAGSGCLHRRWWDLSLYTPVRGARWPIKCQNVRLFQNLLTENP